MKYILLSEKVWHKQLVQELRQRIPVDWLFIDKKEEFTLQKLDAFKPNKIFIPHWSYIIPAEIFEAYECIVFHMTDLPYGRGGSPLQNLIVRGHTETKLSALRVEKGLDEGKIYLKRTLLLHGTAQEIFLRSSLIIMEMIVELHEKPITPSPQTGDPVIFKRRIPKESNIEGLSDINKVYDYIRMLDCEGYPPAFIETQHFRFEFSRATYKDSQNLQADVRIIKK